MFMIYREHRKIVPLQKNKWYRVELLQEPSTENGKVKTVIRHLKEFIDISIKATLSVRINGATILVADIDEVDDIVNMWTVPRRGQAAAQGQIRAITVITADDQKDFEVEPRRKKTLQGQLEQLRMPLRNHPFAL